MSQSEPTFEFLDSAEHSAAGSVAHEQICEPETLIELQEENMPVLLDAARTERQRRRFRSMEVEEITEHARNGDHHAFEALVEATFTDSFTLAQRLMGSFHDAQDVVQEAYLRAYKSIGRFRGESQFTTWLYRIVANTASTQLVRRNRNRHENIDDEARRHVLADHSDSADPEEQAVGNSLRDSVQAALHKLPDTLRVVVVLRDMYDMRHQDIAQELGISESAAKVRLHRARRQLNELLHNKQETTPKEDQS